MNFNAIGGFVRRNGMKILKKTALAAGVIAGIAFLTDTPEDETIDAESFVIDSDGEPTVVESTGTEITEVTQES